jgi:hypothetical protein
MRFRIFLGALVVAASAFVHAAIPPSEQATALEFYHAGYDHYFITADSREVSDLDSGVHPGWVRTGYRFSVMRAGSAYPGTSPVCRFFSEKVTSHFYSSKPSECDEVRVRFADTWLFESPEVLRAFPVDPASGACPADTAPVYRLYNNRADANHRYTDQLSVFVFMKAKGYVPEGDGSPAVPVAFCTPAGGSVVPPPPSGAPQCTVSTSDPAPAAGASVTLVANCTAGPTAFLWSGCSSTTNTCVASRAGAGTSRFTVYAANAQGPAAPASLDVTFGGSAGAVPVCTLTSTNTYPNVGTTITLNAACTQGPTSYVWLECDYYLPSICNPIACSATSPTCAVTSSVSAYSRYTIAGVNAAGTGPRGEAQVEWRSGGNGYTAGFCGQFPRAKRIVVPWGDTSRYTTLQYGGWPADTILVVEFTVPASPPSYATAGYTSLGEYQGVPSSRLMTLSATPCDFRPVDPSGVNGPYTVTSGTVPTIFWNVGAAPIGLAPGRTYYFNFSNEYCGQLTCEASTSTIWPR